MKKLTALIIGLATMLIITQVTASSYTNPVAEFLPEDTVLLISLQPGNSNSTMEALYNEYVPAWFAEEMTDELEGWALDEETYNTTYETIEEATSDAGFSIGVVNTDEVIKGTFITIEMSEDAYNGLTESFGGHLIQVDSEATSPIYYVNAYAIDEDLIDSYGYATYFTYLNGYMILAEDYYDTLEIILDDTKAVLSENADYKEVENEFLSNNIFNMYMDMEFVMEDVMRYDELSNSYEELGLSIKQTTSGFKLQTHLNQDASLFESMGIDATENNGKPGIYEYMPNGNPIFYSEYYNLTYSWDILEKSGTINTEDVAASFDEATSLDLENDILPLFTKGFGFLIDDSNKNLPTLTMMADVSDDTNGASETLTEIIDLLWSYTGTAENIYEIEGEDATITITKSEEEMLGGTMTTFEFDLSMSESKNPYAIEMPEDFFDIVVTTGITRDDILIVTTDSNIANNYGEDLSSDSDFADLLTQAGDEITDMFYFSLDNLTGYTESLFDDIEEAAGEEFTEFADAKTAIDNFFSLFHSLYGDSLTYNEYSDYQLTLTIDFDDLLSIDEYFWETTESAGTSYEVITNSQREFEDVEAEEWYGDDIYYLSTQGVVNGYSNGTFEPSSDITRAEFITMLMRALYQKGYFEDTCSSAYDCKWAYYDSSQDPNLLAFTDVNTWSWSSEYIYTAREVGIVEGYSDGTFHPSDPISRAEAVQMLSNAIAAVEISDDTETTSSIKDFSDVGNEDWYKKAVDNCYYYQIVDGTPEGTFEPTRSINRAESSKIIRRFLEIIE